MLTLPDWIMPLLLEFAPVVRRKTTWHKVEIMVVGAILAAVIGTVTCRDILIGTAHDYFRKAS